MKLTAGLVLALALLASCGGTDGDSTEKAAGATAKATATRDSSAGDAMSPAAWSRRVQAICTESAAKASKAGKRLGRRSAAAGDSERELAYKTLTLTSNQLDPWLDRIEALPKPQGREQKASRFITTMRSVGDLLGRTATAIKQNDETNGKKLVKQLKAKGISARNQARALGIEQCNPPSA